MVVSVRDVAEHVGVSMGTVSNVLNRPDKVNPDLVTRVQAGIAELGYVRNDAARQLRVGVSRTIGVIVHNATNPFFAALVRGAEDRAEALDRWVVVANSHEEISREHRYIDLFAEQRLQGLLVAPLGDDLDHLRNARRHHAGLVMIRSAVPGDEFCTVSGDDEGGGYLATRHLLDLGRRRIAIVCGPMHISAVDGRRRGAQRAVDEVSGARLEVITTSALGLDDGRRVGLEIVGRSPRRRPDAIFTVNDLLALGLMQPFLIGNRVTIPDQIALIGYDDIAFAEAAVVPLSTIRQGGAVQGDAALSLLAQEVDSPRDHDHRHLAFQPELVVRESTVGFS